MRIWIFLKWYWRISENNVHIKLPKCDILKSSTVYLGFEYCGDGVRPVESSVESIKKAPAPTNLSQLRSWLGVVQYYHQYLPDLATVLNPLHRQLQKNVKWHWSSECKQAFKECKNQLTRETLLVHYDPSKK